jgi:hypothetical protein
MQWMHNYKCKYKKSVSHVIETTEDATDSDINLVV